MPFIEPIRQWYGRFERPVSSLSLLGGFVFDAVTLRRVDTLWENIWIFGHLVIVAVFILLIHIRESEIGDEANPKRAHFWYVNILQFFFGGTLSAYLVFYFRSSDILVTWPFVLILALAFWANESLKRHYVRLSFQISLFFLSIYSFSIFLVPVVMHQIGDRIFLFSGLLSLIFISFFLVILFYFARDKFKESRKIIILSVLGITAVINFLYFTNLIPPIPLSLKDAGVYHSIYKNNEGNYVVTFEDRGLRDYFKLYPDFMEVEKNPAYVFSSIFSPRGLNLTIVHEWQYYDPEKKNWKSLSKIRLPVLGGREGGFRTYSARSNLSPGKWRVNIETEEGQVIGQIRFNVVPSYSSGVLNTAVK